MYYTYLENFTRRNFFCQFHYLLACIGDICMFNNSMHVDNIEYFCLQRVREVGKQVGIKPLIIQGEELDKKGFGGMSSSV